MSSKFKPCASAALIVAGLAACAKEDKGYLGAPPTYASDIAPILHKQCAVCHHPGAAAPFSLLSYQDAAKRSRQIAEVTATGYMPPWLPVEGYGHFEGERRLSEEEIVLLDRWHAAGAPPGDPNSVPEPPSFAEGWMLGEPDLIVQLPEAYRLAADGADIYRNFVIPTGLTEPRFVRGVEFRPGHPKAVHHAFVLVDVEGGSRKLDAADTEPGYPGMNTGLSAGSPGGQFVSWQPGKVPSFVPEGMSWRLAAGADLVVQVHLQTLGKVAEVKPSVGLFFTDQPPKRSAYKLVLATDQIDIPPGAPSYTVGSKYSLPVDVEVLGVIPHAHYLGKQLHGFAELPDGRREWIVRIDDWDFNWQGDYRLATPLFLPAGTVLFQQFSYNNSAENPMNPHDPPQRVRWGQNTTDEMAELWIQVVTRNPDDRARLNQHFAIYSGKKRKRQLLAKLERGGDGASLRIDLAKVSMLLGDIAAAEVHIAAAKAADPDAAEAFYLAGRIAADTDPGAAWREFVAAVQRDPEHHAAVNGIGMLALRSGDLDTAQLQFERAVQINPESATSQGNLGLVYLKIGNARLAVDALGKAMAIDPENARWRSLFDQARSRL